MMNHNQLKTLLLNLSQPNYLKFNQKTWIKTSTSKKKSKKVRKQVKKIRHLVWALSKKILKSRRKNVLITLPR